MALYGRLGLGRQYGEKWYLNAPSIPVIRWATQLDQRKR